MGRRNQAAKSTERYLKRTTAAEWRTAIYARLSNENNGLEDDRSLQNQIKYIEEYIGKNPDLELIDTYVDNGRSGMNFERVEFQRMMEDVKSGRINCIVVKDLSRFGRNHIEAGYYLEKIFPQLDVRFISINDNFDNMVEGKKMVLPEHSARHFLLRRLRMSCTATLRNFRYRCSGYSNYRKDDADAPPCAVKITSVPEQVVYKLILDQIRWQLRAGLEVEGA